MTSVCSSENSLGQPSFFSGAWRGVPYHESHCGFSITPFAGQCLSDAMIVEDHGHTPAGAAAQFFCETPSQSGTSGELGLASDTYDECVYREDTLVLLELTTRDMMEVLHAFLLPAMEVLGRPGKRFGAVMGYSGAIQWPP